MNEALAVRDEKEKKRQESIHKYRNIFIKNTTEEMRD
jgi:hypothetical protein